ncbi:MAG: hypothetical protein KGH88_06185 [Thaumarchaeota archaeon]|nr:hypothetical protein [Nitrososphaerota archaeon]
MIPKTLVVIIAGCVGGAFAISVAMMAGSGWETPGMYSGTSDASHAPASTTHCYSFQTECKSIQSATPQSALTSGAFLSGSYSSH